ncbi:MAG TPA: biliverdin-producing heme oxygenase [Flavisolibacter sp.]|nr:biliverdin-producing heme oxygenase [Flavisolibacter sp.]
MSLTFSETSVASALKDATKELHQLAEASLHPKLHQIVSRQDYASILKMFYGYFHPMEALISRYITEKQLPDITERRKSSLIMDDLHSLDCDLKNTDICASLPTINDVLDALGAMYVLEGSSLGGRMITKILLRNQHAGLTTNHLRFFNGYGEDTGPKWLAFQNVINLYKTHEDRLIESANQTFRYFAGWIEQTLYHESKN